jgi:hypothetical protein
MLLPLRRVTAGVDSLAVELARRSSCLRLAGRVARQAWRSALAILLLATCDLPTKPPRWTTDWAIPVGAAVFPVTAFLPKGVTLAPDSTAFLLQITSSRVSARLGNSCARCEILDGLTLPKPAFVMRLAARATLPSDLVSALVRTPEFPIELVNGLNFDPVRPGLENGSIGLEVRSRGAVLGGVELSGEEGGLAPGDTLRLSLPLYGRIREWIELAAVLDSPAGDPVRLDSDLRVTLAMATSELYLLEAQVLVRDRRVTSAPVSVRVDEISTELLDRLEGGRIRVEVQNPFGVHGVFQARISHDRGVLTRDAVLGPEQTNLEIDLSAIELRELLSSGQISVAFVGTVNSDSGGATVRPDQKLVLTPRIYARMRMER